MHARMRLPCSPAAPTLCMGRQRYLTLVSCQRFCFFSVPPHPAITAPTRSDNKEEETPKRGRLTGRLRLVSCIPRPHTPLCDIITVIDCSRGPTGACISSCASRLEQAVVLCLASSAARMTALRISLTHCMEGCGEGKNVEILRDWRPVFHRRPCSHGQLTRARR